MPEKTPAALLNEYCLVGLNGHDGTHFIHLHFVQFLPIPQAHVCILSFEDLDTGPDADGHFSLSAQVRSVGGDFLARGM